MQDEEPCGHRKSSTAGQTQTGRREVGHRTTPAVPDHAARQVTTFAIPGQLQLRGTDVTHRRIQCRVLSTSARPAGHAFRVCSPARHWASTPVKKTGGDRHDNPLWRTARSAPSECAALTPKISCTTMMAPFGCSGELAFRFGNPGVNLRAVGTGQRNFFYEWP